MAYSLPPHDDGHRTTPGETATPHQTLLDRNRGGTTAGSERLTRQRPIAKQITDRNLINRPHDHAPGTPCPKHITPPSSILPLTTRRLQPLAKKASNVALKLIFPTDLNRIRRTVRLNHYPRAPLRTAGNHATHQLPITPSLSEPGSDSNTSSP